MDLCVAAPSLMSVFDIENMMRRDPTMCALRWRPASANLKASRPTSLNVEDSRPASLNLAKVRIEFLELEVPRPASPNLEVPRPASLNLKCRNPSKALETPETAPAFHGVSINSWGEHISPVCSINSGVEHKSPGDEQNGFFSVHANRQPKPSARCAVQIHTKRI